MYDTADIIGGMMRSLRDDVQRCLVRTGAEMAISPDGEHITVLPEFYRLKGEPEEEAGGLGAVIGQPVSGVIESWLLRGDYGVVIHEFAHAIENLCFREDERRQWNRFYYKARRDGLFPDAYGMIDEDEFFAEFTQSYFNRPNDIQWRWDIEDDELTRQKLSGDHPEIFIFLKGIYEGWEVGSFLGPSLGLQQDRETLIALYESTDGPNWTNNWNWLSDEPLWHWLGVTSDRYGRVTRIQLSGNGLTGELPPELGELTNLTSLSLGENRLSGELPSELGNLTNLEDLLLGKNQLSGEIPPELGKLANLTRLYIQDNRLTGELPSELGELSKLTLLSLWGNRLSGELPSELGSLTNLEGLFLWENQLSGEIPPELGNLVKLESLYLLENDLSGQIPFELADLPNLNDLQLSGNSLSGCIPQGLRDVPYNDLAWLGLPSC